MKSLSQKQNKDTNHALCETNQLLFSWELALPEKEDGLMGMVLEPGRSVLGQLRAGRAHSFCSSPLTVLLS